MQFSTTIKTNREFRRLYSKGKSAAERSLVVYCRPDGRGENRYGITVSNKIGKAVHRNRVRRRLREIYRLHESRLRRGMDIVLVARVRSRYVPYWQLEADFLSACTRLGLLAAPPQGDET